MRLIRIHGRIAVPIQMVENSEGANKNEQSRQTDNIWYTKR